MWWVDGACPPRHTVGNRRSNHGLKVHITHGELVSQLVLNGYIVLVVIAQTVHVIAKGPVIIVALVPGSVVRLPAVCTSHHTLGLVIPFGASPIQVERLDLLHMFRWCWDQDGIVNGLVKDSLACVVRDHHVWILETTNTRHSTKVVVKGAVLLHEKHNLGELLQFRVHAMRVVPLFFCLLGPRRRSRQRRQRRNVQIH